MAKLTVISSDRIEELAKNLKERIATARKGADPFDFIDVTVPNINVGKWLKMRIFAKERELCMGVRFPFVEKRLFNLMRPNLKEGMELLPNYAYTMAIVDLLLKKDCYSEFECFRQYMRGQKSKRIEAKMTWQLADKLATLMDTYEVYRPELVSEWMQGNTVTGSSIEQAEGELARVLWGEIFTPEAGKISLRQAYEQVENTEPKGKEETVYLFGQSSLTLLQARILVWLAKKHDVVFYHLNACEEYWGDIETTHEMRKKALAADAVIENPLLSKLGIAGRETLQLLVNLEEGAGVDFAWEQLEGGEDAPRTVLEKLQKSIRERTSTVEQCAQDASIQVIGTPGIRREIEMVYNSILGSVWRPERVEGKRPWPECNFSDIAVVVPDMATYKPIIESVFKARKVVPYGILDASAAMESDYLSGFLALMDLGQKGLSRQTLFAVLDNSCVQTAMGFSREDVNAWRKLTEQIGAFDGFSNGESCDQYFSWDWALMRLRLGNVADELQSADGKSNLPLEQVAERVKLRFSEVVELLYRELHEAFAINVQSCKAWQQTLLRIANMFLAPTDDSEADRSVQKAISQILDELTSISTVLSCEYPVAAVAHFVGGGATRTGGYLTDGVSIATFQSLSGVPFRQVYVVGLSAGGFPGRMSTTTLDVRGAATRLGDISTPNMNRYLFLMQLMSVRNRLVLSYTNHDIEKDAEQFPSSIIRELETFLSSFISKDEKDDDKNNSFKEFIGFPLLEHGEANMTAEQVAHSSVCPITWDVTDKFAGLLPTYSAVARKVAVMRNVVPAAENTIPVADELIEGVPLKEYNVKHLAEFIKSPLKAVLQNRLGIVKTRYDNNEIESESPLDIGSGPDLWNLQLDWLKQLGDGEQGAENANVLQNGFTNLQHTGHAPATHLGDFVWGNVSEGLVEHRDDVVTFMKEWFECLKPGHIKSGRVTVKLANDDERYFAYEHSAWLESGNATSVLLTSKISKDEKAAPHRVLEALLTFAVDVATKNNESEYILRIGIIDVEAGAWKIWLWKLQPNAARSYLNNLVMCYDNYLIKAKEGLLPVVEYQKVVKNYQVDDTAQLLKSVITKGYERNKSYDDSLVVQMIAEAMTREPTQEEFKAMLEGIYSLPLQGEVEGDSQAKAKGAK